MKKGKWSFIGIMLILGAVGVFRYGVQELEKWKESHSGIPDAVSSMSSDNWQYLKVVAFARKVIQMCRENSFHSIRFSTDINGYPSGVDITVYLNRKDLEKGEAVCEIEFRTEGYREDCDIKNDVEQFHLYLDGTEIDFIIEDSEACDSAEH